MVLARENIVSRSLANGCGKGGLRWYAIHTKPAKEDQVVANISRMGVEVFNPKTGKMRKVWGKPKEMVGPLFPCYVFAKLSNSFLSATSYVRGVRRIVGFGGGPTPIDEQVIEAIRSHNINVHGETSKIQPGEAVVVNRGALYGLEGVFVEQLSGKDRVVILLKSIGLQARVQVEKSAIEISPDR